MDGFGPGPAQGPTYLGWAGPAQIGLGPKNFGPNPSLTDIQHISKLNLKAVHLQCLNCFFKVKKYLKIVRKIKEFFEILSTADFYVVHNL